jgi:hypothetical protein
VNNHLPVAGKRVWIGVLSLWVTGLCLLDGFGPRLTAGTAPLVTLRTDTAAFSIDETGSMTAITPAGHGVNYVAPGQPAPLLSLRLDGKLHAPTSARWEASSNQLVLGYGLSGVKAVVSAVAQPSHVRFEVLDVQPVERVQLVLWGPYPTTISNIIGETVGVVRNGEFAIGIQALNVKTLGGYPHNDSDVEGGWSGDDLGNYPDLPAELLRSQGYRGDTARRTEFGSVLRAYCRDRSREEVVANWGHPKFGVPAFHDGGVVGSRIALFACPADQALRKISQIEVSEGLPHPMIDGVWGKTSPGATASYLIVDFSEDNVDRAIEMTRRAGLKYLYHSSPFATWGHFKLKPGLFPHGWDGLRACVDKARAAGVRVGAHMLSNFITPNDAYVSPDPDPRLAQIGASELSSAVDAAQTEIPVLAPDYFTRKSALNTVRIGDEFVRFGAVSAEAPWRLLQCQRGAWGTHAVSHSKGAAVGRLLDHDYKVFLSDADLSQEIARNLAALFNHAGLLQTSFDGLEGNWSTGYGQYGCALFTKAWFDALDPILRGHVIDDASLPGHFNWHINTRMNWGEPWYGGFRESQTLYRFKNQVYFERNLMPHMLGWFALRPDTSIEDAEWLLARAAGFNAGFALATSLASTAQLAADPDSADTARRFGAMPAILAAIKQWETARMSGTFSSALRSRLRDNSREFHLQTAPGGGWELREVHPIRFTHDASLSSASEFQFEGPQSGQSLHWIVRATGKEPITGLRLEMNGRIVADLKQKPLPPGGSLKYQGGGEAMIADAHWTEVARAPVDLAAAQVAPGHSSLTIRCAPAPGATLKIELRLLDPVTRIVQAVGSGKSEMHAWQ